MKRDERKFNHDIAVLALHDLLPDIKQAILRHRDVNFYLDKEGELLADIERLVKDLAIGRLSK